MSNVLTRFGEDGASTGAEVLMALHDDLEVLKQEECRGCGRPGDGRCKASPDRNFYVCFHTEGESSPEVRLVKQNAICRCFVVIGSEADRDEHAESLPTPSRNGKAKTHALSLDSSMRRYQAALSDEETARHAATRGVSVEALRAYGCGSNEGNLCWPEYAFANGKPRISAIITIGSDGVKRAGKGHRRGIGIPMTPVESDYPAVLAEGVGDGMACHDMGILAFCRPNNVCGGEILAEALTHLDTSFLIVADNDDAGRTGAEKLCLELAGRLGCPVAWATTPPPHKDARAFLIYCREKGIEPATAGGLFIEHLKKNAITVEPEIAIPAEIPEQQPFPLDCLAPKIQRIVENASKALGVDASMVALPLLVVFAGLIGNSRRLLIKSKWTVPAILWAAIVGASGDGKTPPIEFALRQLTRLYGRALQQYASDVAGYNAALADWNAKPKDERGPKPKEPVLSRILADDITVEGLIAIHQENPRGLCVVADELSGLVTSFNQYKSRGGSDMARWESMFSGMPIMVDRKGGSGAPRQRYFIPRACVSICGGLQPATMLRVFKDEHFETGFVARILFTMPPARLRTWTDAEISDADELDLEAIVDRLYSIEPEKDETGELKPKFLGMSRAAKEAFIAFYNEHCAELYTLRGNIRAAWTKKEGYVGRLALVLHLARWAAGDTANPDQVDEVSVRNAIKLVQWFAQEDRRVYAMLDEGAEGRESRELVELILLKSKGTGRATPRDLQLWCRRRFPTSEDAEATLNKLAKEGRGQWDNNVRSESGRGAPKRMFIVRNCVRAERIVCAQIQTSEPRKDAQNEG